MFTFVPPFPEGYDWREHDRRKHAARMKLDARWIALREQIPAMHRITNGGMRPVPLDNVLVNEALQIVLAEVVLDLNEAQELACRHGGPPPDAPESPAPAER